MNIQCNEHPYNTSKPQKQTKEKTVKASEDSSGRFRKKKV